MMTTPALPLAWSNPRRLQVRVALVAAGLLVLMGSSQAQQVMASMQVMRTFSALSADEKVEFRQSAIRWANASRQDKTAERAKLRKLCGECVMVFTAGPPALVRIRLPSDAAADEQFEIKRAGDSTGRGIRAPGGGGKVGNESDGGG